MCFSTSYGTPKSLSCKRGALTKSLLSSDWHLCRTYGRSPEVLGLNPVLDKFYGRRHIHLRFLFIEIDFFIPREQLFD